MENQSAKIKEEFTTGLPPEIADFLTATIPKPPTLSTPDNVDDAIIAQGVLSVYLLDVFNSLAGFSIASAMMHIGELNAVNQVMALASLRIDETAHIITVVLPSSTVAYSVDSEIMCEVSISGDLSGVESVTMTREDPDASTTSSAMLDSEEVVENELLPADIVEEGHYYAPQIISTAGEYLLTFSATIEGEQYTSETITLTVV